MNVDLYLIRHGEAESNIASHAARNGDMSFKVRLAHKSPSEYRLTTSGIAQATCARKLLVREAIQFDEIAVSPILRAIETSLIATEGVRGAGAPIVDELLSERSWGVHERSATSLEEHEELWRDRVHFTNLDWHPRGGDSYMEMLLRARMIIDRYVRFPEFGSIQKRPGNFTVGLFSHAEMIWFIERVLRGDTNANDPTIPLPHEMAHNCAVHHFQINDGNAHRMRSNSKENLERFGKWTKVKFAHPTRAELRNIVERSSPVIF